MGWDWGGNKKDETVFFFSLCLAAVELELDVVVASLGTKEMDKKMGKNVHTHTQGGGE
jgi:hypothetical protein